MRKNISGLIQGKLTVVQPNGSEPKKGVMWLCVCECGKYVIYPTSYFSSSSKVKSCGCNRPKGMGKPKGYKEKEKRKYTRAYAVKIGETYGRLTVTVDRGSIVNRGHIHKLWECVCVCGKAIITNTRDLRSGDVRSCGCLKNKYKDLPKTDIGESKHKQARSRPYILLYSKWSGIISRCYNHKDPGYKNYGGRGITVCDEWRNDFKDFFLWSINNGWQYGRRIHIDRVDNDGPYSPENCRYVDVSVNARNKRNNIYIEFKGIKYQILDLLELVGTAITPASVCARIKSGWSVEEAVLLPKLDAWTRKKNPHLIKSILEEKLNEFRLNQNKDGA